MLEVIDGFIDNERFESRRREGWVLSLSTWRDEKAVVRWRSQGEHHKVQEQGRSGIFSDYHLRVCEVTADTHPPRDLQVIEQRLDATQTGSAKALTITEISPTPEATFAAYPDLLTSRLGLEARAEGLLEYDAFESITNPGKMLLLTSWQTAADAARWTPSTFSGVAELRHRCVRNVRDYGLFERREAAQYFPEVQRASRG
jgi:heme-degrading monooxygenase HmoA